MLMTFESQKSQSKDASSEIRSPITLGGVLILAHSWPPDANVGAVRPVYLARQLARLGWQPIIITVREHYYELQNPAGVAGTDSALVIRTRCLPNPRKGYLWIKDQLAKIRRLANNLPATLTDEKVPPNGGYGLTPPGSSPLKRTLLSLLYTPDEFLGWFPFAIYASLRAIARYQPKCMVTTGPPFTSHLVGLTLKGICGTKWIADFRDPWSWREGLSADIVSTTSERINLALERKVLRSADRVVCVTSTTTDRYRELYPDVSDNKWVTITNGYDLDEFATLGSVEKPDRFTVSYVGSFDFSRTPLLLLRAIGELVLEGKLDRHNITVRFVGPCYHAGGRSVADLIAENGLNGIAEIVGFVPRPEALRETLRANVLVLLGGTQRLSIAAKVYEYIAAGKPILAITEEGATAEIIRRVGQGQVVAPDNVEGAKEAIAFWYGQFLQEQEAAIQKPPSHSSARDEYSWDRLGVRYASLLVDCCKDR